MEVIERLAWDVSVARTRSNGDRERIARYITALVEPLARLRLVVGLGHCPDDVLSGCVVQAQPAVQGAPM